MTIPEKTDHNLITIAIPEPMNVKVGEEAREAVLVPHWTLGTIYALQDQALELGLKVSIKNKSIVDPPQVLSNFYRLGTPSMNGVESFDAYLPFASDLQEYIEHSLSILEEMIANVGNHSPAVLADIVGNLTNIFHISFLSPQSIRLNTDMK